MNKDPAMPMQDLTDRLVQMTGQMTGQRQLTSRDHNLKLQFGGYVTTLGELMQPSAPHRSTAMFGRNPSADRSDGAT